MSASSFIHNLRNCPLVASVQATEGSPVDNPSTLSLLAQASRDEGVTTLRLQGVENIRSIRKATQLPCIGLIKRAYADSEIYITATRREVLELLETGCEVIALDGTPRTRPGGENLGDLIALAHAGGIPVLADIDSVSSARFAVSMGADMVSTTLGGYTKEYVSTGGPDLELLRTVKQAVEVPVFAEGRYALRWQCEAALRIGAVGVIVGGVLNDPIKTTRAIIPSKPPKGRVGAVDIGGTWMRFGVFSNDWKLESIERMPLLEKRDDRLAWIRSQVQATGVLAVGVSTGGTVDARTGELWEAKALIPDHVGSIFSEKTLGVPTVALNDGLASAWGHANLPKYAGKRVATLAIGTGVGCGFVAEGRILMGPRGEYPRLNDMPGPGGSSFESMLGGAALSPNPSATQKATALQAFIQAGIVLQEMYFPDQIVVCGAVGLSDWLAPYLTSPGLSPSPFGMDAGIYGAASLVLHPEG
ncbi:MAG: putative N-acetylmannosamine-6-phosphate 2-epimerase [Fimbriimonas sp.]|nr:putative N-acetylmannosamine-6-phosphate 2-epimerase [Fimbriimonas sp.]